MKLKSGLHLAYCTNIHRGDTWAETFAALQHYTLPVRERVSPSAPYAIGLRLSNQAATELSEPAKLQDFKQWLGKHNCYVFTINGFPYGSFHGVRVKEQVYLPDWSNRERVDYTKRITGLLADVLPEGVDGSVSTVPLGFKSLVATSAQRDSMCANLWEMIEHLDALEKRTGRYVHLGLEPEPGCVLENTPDTLAFFRELRAVRPNDPRWQRFLGINYDTCHFAVEYENAKHSLDRLRAEGINLSKLHLSSALKVRATTAARQALKGFIEPVYFHQTLVRRAGGATAQYADLDDALSREPVTSDAQASEWRIHFHVPLHSPPAELFDTTADHLRDALDWLTANPRACTHLEMETYTWEVLPPALKSREVVDQVAAEYEWTLSQLRQRGLA